MFVDRVREFTKGEVEIDCKDVGVIAPAFKGFDAVMDGLADAHHTTTLYIVNKHPANSFFANHPGGMVVEAFWLWLYQKGGGQDLMEAMHRETMKLQTWGQGYAPQELWISHTPITKPEDLKGKKFRTAGVWAQILNDKFGAAATTIPGDELYVMMERKALDVLEWSGPFENLNTGLEKTAKYLITPGYHWPGGVLHFSVSNKTWDGLSPDLKKQVMAASKLANFESYIEWHYADLDAMATLQKGNNEWIRLDQGMLDAISKAGREWAEQQAETMSKKGDTWMRSVTDSYYQFFDNWNANAVWKPPLISGRSK